MGLPLVSCVMPTYGRPDFVAESIAMFLAQDYPAKELIVLNDCPGQVLSGDFPDVKIVNAPHRWATLGEKRNAAIELARGEFIAVWDDDDIYFPWRLAYSMRRIEQLNTSLYCPAEYWAYWGDENLLDNRAVLDWIYHPLIVFRKELWRAVGGYPAQTLHEDTAFFEKVLRHFGMDWPQDNIARYDRLMIMRGKSKYAHTSIQGGSEGPDTSPREVPLIPRPIHDPILLSIFNRLITQRKNRLSSNLTTYDVARAWGGIPANGNRSWLDKLNPMEASVGYGALGLHGALGYENKRVEIRSTRPDHSLSTHAPARLAYALERRYSHFCSHVAINDDIAPGQTAADFILVADGKLVGVAANVRPHQSPRLLMADVTGVRELELIVRPHRWDFCHTVWIDPYLVLSDAQHENRTFINGLQRAEIAIPSNQVEKELCIATVGSPGFEDWIDDLLGSICANAQCPEALLAIFFLGDTPEIRRIADKYRAALIPCRPLRPINAATKSIMYSAGRAIRAAKFICLDADMLVLEDLRPIVAAIDAAPSGSILCCREGNWTQNLGDAIQTIYGGHTSDFSRILGDEAGHEQTYPLVVNDGFFAGSCAALCALDDLIRSWPQAAAWVDDPHYNFPWRNQFIFNLALARGQMGLEVDPRYNVQFHSQSAEFREVPCGIEAKWNHSQAAIVHFSGWGRGKYPEWRGRYRANAKPLTRMDRDETYDDFADALRKWAGKFGHAGLAWSFYGTTDGLDARVGDPATFSLLATLHYLIRSNGCIRIIESGTARGISTACLASAVSHHANSQVVSLDVTVFPEREALWAGLPYSIRRCIAPRQCDSLIGLRAAIQAGETYHAALLDSLHSAEHVLKEFELARQLVCPGGLILIHDPILKTGTVGEALDKISDQGYGVVRLWTAEGGVQEDDGLGLAVIENRRRITN